MRALVLLLLLALTIGAKCGTPPIDVGCPDLSTSCPNLECVEHAVDANACPICECAVQACLLADDCEPRDPPQRCDIGNDVCEPAPACTDGDDDTVCPAACFGRCTPPGEGSDAFCTDFTQCNGGDCRFDGRFCLIDPENPGICSGWCVNGCDDVVVIASDPRTFECFEFFDSCIPPGFSLGCK